MYWKDERIQGVPIGGDDFVNVNGKEIDNFWIPDVFIDQAKSLRAPTFYVNPSTVRVYADGTIRYVFFLKNNPIYLLKTPKYRK